MFLDTVAQLLDLPRLRVWLVDLTPAKVTNTATPDTTTAACPLCQNTSRRVHSRYNRTGVDLAWGARTVTFNLEVRRFFCEVKICVRQIFTERLPEMVARSARRTTRLRGRRCLAIRQPFRKLHDRDEGETRRRFRGLPTSWKQSLEGISGEQDPKSIAHPHIGIAVGEGGLCHACSFFRDRIRLR